MLQGEELVPMQTEPVMEGWSAVGRAGPSWRKRARRRLVAAAAAASARSTSVSWSVAVEVAAAPGPGFAGQVSTKSVRVVVQRQEQVLGLVLGWCFVGESAAPVVAHSLAAADVPAASYDAHSLLLLQDGEVGEEAERRDAMCGADDGMRMAGQCQLKLCCRCLGARLGARLCYHRTSQSSGPYCTLACVEVGLQAALAPCVIGRVLPGNVGQIQTKSLATCRRAEEPRWPKVVQDRC